MGQREPSVGAHAAWSTLPLSMRAGTQPGCAGQMMQYRTAGWTGLQEQTRCTVHNAQPCRKCRQG